MHKCKFGKRKRKHREFKRVNAFSLYLNIVRTLHKLNVLERYEDDQGLRYLYEVNIEVCIHCGYPIINKRR